MVIDPQPGEIWELLRGPHTPAYFEEFDKVIIDRVVLQFNGFDVVVYVKTMDGDTRVLGLTEFHNHWCRLD